jgi:hypothetical protein
MKRIANGNSGIVMRGRKKGEKEKERRKERERTGGKKVEEEWGNEMK